MELIIQDDYSHMQSKVYIKVDRGSNIVIIGYDGENLIEQTLPENILMEIAIKPLFIVPFHMKDQLIKAFITEGAKNNLRTENENLLKGKLEATQLHLEDMRELTKKLINAKLL